MNTKAFEHFTESAQIQHGLPAYAYTSEDFHKVENESVFSHAWVFVGFAHELKNRGDVMPIEVGGQPLLLVRGEAGQIVAFHNVCRHRCLKLVAQSGNVGRLIRCPYHSWAYDLEGALKATPFFGGVDNQTPAGFDMAENGLYAVQCRVWYDWIFVNLSEHPQDFDEFLAPLRERLARWDLSKLNPIGTVDFSTIHCNWKFLMENFIEPYHVQFVHATTTEQPLSDHKAFIDRHCLGCTVEMEKSTQKSGTLAVDSAYLALFPNFVLATYAPDQLGVHINMPINASQTTQRRVIYLLRDEVKSSEIEDLKNLWWKVHKEDHVICERLQLGRQSSVAATGGWLSPVWEKSVRRFHDILYDSVRPFL